MPRLLYIDDVEYEPQFTSTPYSVTSTGFNIDGSTVWNYSGAGTFLGFSYTEGASTPSTGLSIGDSGTFADLQTSKADVVDLYSVASSGGGDMSNSVTVTYNGNTIYTTTESAIATIKTAGTYCTDDIVITLTTDGVTLHLQDGTILNLYGAYTRAQDNATLTIT